MSLDNPNVTRTLNVSGRTDDLMIDKLTFEPLMKSLYWINRSNSTNSTIERFDIQSGTLAIIAADAAPVSGIYTFATTLHHHYINITSLAMFFHLISALTPYSPGCNDCQPPTVCVLV